ncbi:Na/Pi cotransporter family protein [Phaeobacter porticola]|uniref:Putative Na+/Pi-cotransporter n=1 Tax=Phaeobacter porticola TaxID=1844006 RepID=A0A1L3IAS7_9RHOB|nr:Na/Pi symporter [Phaeobacter porticola]APG49133.1 putative Na+/Pi-cotransporter [Phaeobacter porticola]
MAILLGADVGSAIVSQVLLLRQDFLVPLLLLVGVILFLRSSRNEIRQLGRILIGIALIFVSLDMIRAATGPLIDNPATIGVMRYLGGDVLTSFVIGAFFAWAVHSSVAAVLFFVTLSAQGLLPPTGAAAMVLGANAGGAFLAYMLTLTAPLIARRVVVTNVVLRGGGAALLLVVLLRNPGLLTWLGESASRQAINLHLAFNAGLALLAMPFLKWITVLAEHMMPEHAATNADAIQTTALDPAALDQPPRALDCATREIMKMGETTETILRASIVLFKSWDAAAAKASSASTTSLAVRPMSPRPSPRSTGRHWRS